MDDLLEPVEPAEPRRWGASTARRRRVLIALVTAIALVGAALLVTRDDGADRNVSTAGDPTPAAMTPGTAPAADTTSTTDLSAATTSTEPAVVATSTTAAIPPTTSTTIESRTFRGLAVDPEGQPLAGVWVYSDTDTGGPRRTASDGTYRVPCPTRSILLSGSRVIARGGYPLTDEVNVVPTAVVLPDGSPVSRACAVDPVRIVTVMQPGGIIEGRFLDPDDNLRYYIAHDRLAVLVELAHFPVPAWRTYEDNSCNPSTFCHDLGGFDYLPEDGLVNPDGTRWQGTYRVVGVPPGDVRVQVPDKDAVEAGGRVVKTVHVVAGATTQLDVTMPPPGYCTVTQPGC